MRRGYAVWILLASAGMLASASPAMAQLSEFVWDSSKTGNQLWQQSGNWAPAGFPNGALQTANLSRPLAAGLNVDIGSGVTVAGIKMGGTAGPVATTISSSSSLLTFQNDIVPPMLTTNADFNGDSYVNGQDFLIWQRNLGATGQTSNNNGDANADTLVNAADLIEWKSQFGKGSETFAVGSASLETTGVAGSTNTVSANVFLNNEQLGIAGDRNLALNGNLSYTGDPNNAGVSASALRVISPGLTVTLNGGIAFTNSDTLEAVDFSFNDSERNQGSLVINGLLSGTGDIAIGTASNSARLPLGTVTINGANTFTGSIRAGRGNLVLGNDNAIGVDPGPTSDPSDDTLGTYRQAGPANQFGYNLISTDDSRVIRNNMTVAQWQTFKGDHSLTWAGNITQTNNRGLINMLPAGKTLTLSGRIDIWEDNEDVERRFVFDGTGKTRITGAIHDDPTESGLNRRIRKTGTGVLVIDVAPGANTHTGPEIVDMGNLHYANNDSLNVGAGLIVSQGGAVGVDTGVSNNATFMAKIDPTSHGGLMLAASDAAATLDFTSTLANAANMTVAAPETGMTFTGDIIPANNKYQLGGGMGTLTLPSAQLTGANKLEVRNGGTVQLLGNNTYTGSTTVLTKYTSTSEAQAAVDSNNTNLSVGGTYYSQVAPTLVVNKLANGGTASSIGSAASDAANLLIQGSTLKYVGAGDNTNRLFTIGTGGATIDSSGTGAVVFSNTGALGRADAGDKTGDIDDFTGNPNELYNVSDTSDIIAGMTVSDPDAGGIGPPPVPRPIIPAGTTVTGVSDDGKTIGLSANFGFFQKLHTRLVFGTVPRTLTLTGSNGGGNTIASQITNSDKGGVVGITKTGAGTWVLTGNNTYTGATTVQQGTLNAVAMGGNLVETGGTVAPAVGVGTLNIGGTFTQSAGSALAIELASGSSFDVVHVTGAASLAGSIQVSLLSGFNPAVGSTFDILTASSLSLSAITVSGPGGWSATAVGNTLRLTRTALSSAATAVVAEPTSAGLAMLALATLSGRIRRRRAVRS